MRKHLYWRKFLPLQEEKENQDLKNFYPVFFCQRVVKEIIGFIKWLPKIGEINFNEKLHYLLRFPSSQKFLLLLPDMIDPISGKVPGGNLLPIHSMH